jgi:pilus assembly protein Flp/PilA
MNFQSKSKIIKVKGVLTMERLKKFLRDEHGSNAIEYALIAILIALVIVAGATAVGTTLDGTFSTAATSLGGT